MEPRNEIVANVITVFGGLEGIAVICSVGRSAVCQWRKSIPSKHQSKLLDHARKNNIQFSAEDFFRVKAEAAAVSAAAGSVKRLVGSRDLHLIS